MATDRLKMTMTSATQPTSLSNAMSPGDHCHSPRSVRSIIAVSRNNTTHTSLKAQFALQARSNKSRLFCSRLTIVNGF